MNSVNRRDMLKLAGLGSVGWGFGNGLRLEVEGNYRNDTLQHFRGTRFPTLAGGLSG